MERKGRENVNKVRADCDDHCGSEAGAADSQHQPQQGGAPASVTVEDRQRTAAAEIGPQREDVFLKDALGVAGAQQPAAASPAYGAGTSASISVPLPPSSFCPS